MVDTWVHNVVMWLLSAGILFWQLLINHNMDLQYQVVGSHTTTFL